ncbi:hypothetical protein PV762_20435 [Mitsuaria sp. CC2]|uniref:hypothetical protein n=1 Tax=Mitsuaria sp. CC2 TaxID=3029186 RepID=UPI003B8C5528
MNPLSQTLPTVPVGACAATAPMSSHECIDADKVAALMSQVQAWNARKLPPVEMAVGALEFLATGRADGFERATEAPPPARGEASRSTTFKRSIPEMVDAASQRGVRFHYTLGMERERIELGNQMSRGWALLPEASKTLASRFLQSSQRQLRPAEYTPPSPFFKNLVDALKEGDSMMLVLPSNDVLLMARAEGGQLIAVAPDELCMRLPGVCSSKVYAGEGAQQRFDRAYYMAGRQPWAILKPQ